MSPVSSDTKSPGDTENMSPRDKKKRYRCPGIVKRYKSPEILRHKSPEYGRYKSPEYGRYNSPEIKRDIRLIVGVDNAPRYRDIAPSKRYKPRDKDIGEIRIAPRKLSRYPPEGQLIPMLPPPWSNSSSHTAGSRLSETSDRRYPVFSSSSGESGMHTAGVDTVAGKLESLISGREKGAKGRTHQMVIPVAERGDKTSRKLAEVVNGKNGDDMERYGGENRGDIEDMGADTNVDNGADTKRKSRYRNAEYLARSKREELVPARSKWEYSGGQRHKENRGFDDIENGGFDDKENRGSGDTKKGAGADIEFVGFFGITGSKVPIRRSVATHCSLSDAERSPGSQDTRGEGITKNGASFGDTVGQVISKIGDRVSAWMDTKVKGREKTELIVAYDVPLSKRRGCHGHVDIDDESVNGDGDVWASGTNLNKRRGCHGQADIGEESVSKRDSGDIGVDDPVLNQRRGYHGHVDTEGEKVSKGDTEKDGEDTMSGKVVVSKPAPSRGLNASTSDTAMGVLQGEETEWMNLGSMGPSNVPTSAKDGCYIDHTRKSPQALRASEIHTDGLGAQNPPGGGSADRFSGSTKEHPWSCFQIMDRSGAGWKAQRNASMKAVEDDRRAAVLKRRHQRAAVRLHVLPKNATKPLRFMRVPTSFWRT